MKIKSALASFFLKILGWKPTEFPDVGNCVIAVAPHTSMWDFLWGKLYILSKRRESCVLIKKEIFKFPLGWLLKMAGGVPVDRMSPQSLAKQLPKLFDEKPGLAIAITPEGTRKKTNHWKKGFIFVAKAAQVPIVIGFINYKTKELGVLGVMDYNGDEDEIMNNFKRKFIGMEGKHPEKFITGIENE
ncbi:MAG TPA: 1-acyl-sn-glycerol-3-phosphate acyltransferase [Bacteroidales bacterium]|nr:1-acyl-sn-glycerol-3-phosphate acyltransferase [Bacteroidales bacterium]